MNLPAASSGGASFFSLFVRQIPPSTSLYQAFFTQTQKRSFGAAFLLGRSTPAKNVNSGWTLPPLVDRKINVKYNGRVEKDGKARERTAGVHPGIQGRGGSAGRKARETGKPDSRGVGYQR
jgi:hypothetical protein